MNGSVEFDKKPNPSSILRYVYVYPIVPFMLPTVQMWVESLVMAVA